MAIGPSPLNPSAAEWIRWFWTTLIAVSALGAVVYGAILWTSRQEGVPASFDDYAWFFIPALIIILSYRAIDFDEIASIKFAGYPVGNTGPGPKVIPWPLSLTPWPRNAQQEQFPADPELIFKGLDNEALPIMPDGRQMVRAIRITTGRPVEDEKNPLAIQMALEFVFFLRIQIIDPLRFELKYGSVLEFWRQVRDTGEKVLNSKVSQTPGVAAIIQNTNELMDALETKMEELCAEGGVSVIESGLNAPDLTHALAEALRDIGKKRAEGSGSASVISQEGVAKAGAEAVLIEKIKAVLVDADQATIAAYVGKTALSDKTTVLGAEGISQLFGLGELLSSKKGGS